MRGAASPASETGQPREPARLIRACATSSTARQGMLMTAMKAVTFGHFGPPEVLQVCEVERPEPGRTDVLVHVRATGVCHHDVLSRAGRIPPDRPGRILGHEIAGEIAAIGSDVPSDWLGARVVVYHRVFCRDCRHCHRGRHDLCATSEVLGQQRDGGYAEFTCVPVHNVIRIPHGLALPTAALAVCPIATSVRATLAVGRIGPGDVVLVVGAGGGLGLHQIQIAKAVNAHVIGVTSSQRKLTAIREAGADEVIVAAPTTPTFSRDVWRLTGKQGADVVLENVVTGTFGESLRATTKNAIVVVLGNIGARPVEMDPGLIIARRIRISGSGNATFEDVQRAFHLIAAGAVRAVIERIVPFDRAAEAHALIEQRAVAGRIVLSGW